MTVRGGYAMAKARETCDEQILSIVNNVISGHSLKHVAAAIASYYVIKWVKYLPETLNKKV